MSGKKRDPKKNELAQKILDAYQPESVEDMQEALKDIFGPLFETMLKGEMNHHLGMTVILKMRNQQIIEEMVTDPRK